MSVIDTLVYDRTYADVERLRELVVKIMQSGYSSLTEDEKAEYMNSPKGAWNYTDLNRISEAVTYIRNAMNSFLTNYASDVASKGLGGSSAYDPYYDVWDLWNLPVPPVWTAYVKALRTTAKQMLDAVNALRSLIEYDGDLPEVPTLTALRQADYSTANDLERLLYELYQAVTAYSTAMYDRTARAVKTNIYAGEFTAGEA